MSDGQAQATSVIASASDQNFESDAGAASSIASITQTPLPLTTIYTPPASCSQIVTWDGDNLWQYGTNQTGGDCYPPDFNRIFNSYYTPGICPDAWTSAGKIAHSSGHDAMCCPKSVDRSPSETFVSPANIGDSGYTLSRHLGYACASIFSNVLKSVYFTSTASNDPIPSGVSFTTVNPSGRAGTIIADVIQVQWQDKDQKIISLMSERTATGAAKTGATQTAPTPAATSTQKAEDSGGMSTGAKIGIGVAVPIIVLALLAIAAIFFLRIRKRRAAGREEPSIENDAKNLHELPPQDLRPNEKKWDRQQRINRLADQAPQEMEAQEYNELPADGPKHELGGQPMQRSSSYKHTYHAQSPSTS